MLWIKAPVICPSPFLWIHHFPSVPMEGYFSGLPELPSSFSRPILAITPAVLFFTSHLALWEGYSIDNREVAGVVFWHGLNTPFILTRKLPGSVSAREILETTRGHQWLGTEVLMCTLSSLYNSIINIVSGKMIDIEFWELYLSGLVFLKCLPGKKTEEKKKKKNKKQNEFQVEKNTVHTRHTLYYT